MNPAQHLTRLLLRYRGTALVGAAVRLGLIDLIADDERLPLAVLAAGAGIEERRLEQLMGGLVAVGVFEEDADGTYGLTASGRLLREAAFRHVAVFASAVSAPAYGGLAALRTGKEPFREVFGAGFYDYLKQEPELAEHYQAMLGPQGIAEAVAGGIDFGSRHVVDVGGGRR